MALRVTHSMMYGASIRGMNRTLNDLMESNLQSSTQKRINRPSDDPSGTGRVLAYRASLNTMVRYRSNVSQATGWINTIDTTLAGNEGAVQSILSAISTLSLQGSTGTITGENRDQIASQLRGYMETLVGLANTKFGEYHVFAGHKTDQPPYSLGLGVDCLDSSKVPAGRTNVGYYDADNPGDPNNTFFTVTGASDKLVIFKATNGSGTPGEVVDPDQIAGGSGGSGTAGDVVDANLATYSYSTDGGHTWKYAAAPEVVTEKDAAGNDVDYCVIKTAASDPDGGIEMKFNLYDYGPPPNPQNPKQVTLADESNSAYGDNGTWFMVRPTAIYHGDDNDATHVEPVYPPTGTTPSSADGHFTRDVAVRIDAVDGGTGEITYSYSLDDGNNWIGNNKAPGTGTDIRLPVPGGYLNFGATAPAVGEQFNIHPHRADVDFQIGESSTITVNMVGKDVFGGIYSPHCEDPYKMPKANMFETVGRLIGMAEYGSQEGFQEALEQLKEVMKHITTKAAVAGGRGDRLLVTQAAITNQVYNQEEGLSAIEDIDITELMTRLAQQQLAYNSALKSSSMIMQMSLVNFL